MIDVDNPIFVAAPLQIVCEAGVGVTLGVGLTVTTTSTVEPLHVPMEGNIVYVTVASEVVPLVSVCAIGLPLEFENPPAVPVVWAAVHE